MAKKLLRFLNPRKLATIAISFFMVICMAFGVILTGCGVDETPTNPDGSDVNNPNTPEPPPPMLDDSRVVYTPTTGPDLPSGLSTYDTKYKTSSLVGYSSEILGYVTRNKPVAEIRDGGLESGYPTYGYTLKNVIGGSEDKVAARNALIAESSYLTATGTANAGGGNYRWMDKNGYLYNGTTAEPELTYDKKNNWPRQLYKHTASVGLYLGDVADSEPGIVKRVTMRNRAYNSYGVTGVYAPAGEVIKIEISEKDMEATGGIVIHIGQALYNGQANNIWTAKGQMQRIPHLLNTMVVTKDTSTLENGVYTAYVGSFIGGPLYIRNESATFSVTISGGVRYSHFILGYTTPEEFEYNSKSSAPYFDLEVWKNGVLHSGPLTYAKAFDYDDLYKVAVLWDKVSTVATTNGSSQGIVFLYDPFVAAGAAVAFPGRSSVNCPMGWMASSLNYNSLVASGSWGNFHEYHHNFQNFGIGYTGEVTNNAMTLVSYSLFTKISAARQIEAYGAQGLGGWNNYTSASWALAMVNANNINSTSGLAVYSTLLHNFGQDAFISARGSSGVNYFNKWTTLTHNDFSYYAEASTRYAGSDLSQNAAFVTNADYPLFVPVASVYQTGRSYMYDNEKRDIETMQPYVIPYSEPFTVDLTPYTVNAASQYVSGSIVIGNGFKYRIKGIDATHANGTWAATGEENVYTFTPTATEEYSGKIRVTLELSLDETHTNYAHYRERYGNKKLDDVDLILEFRQSHETNKMTLERTTYTFDAANMPTDAREAFESNFAGNSGVETINHTNPTQNANTDIWYYIDNEANRQKYPNAPDHHFVKENTVSVVDGKLYFQEDGKYRIYLRGRQNCALYYSLDGKEYTLGAYINDNSTTYSFRLSDANTYFDVELEGGSWVYIKEVLINKQINNSQTSFIGVGTGTWTEPQYRMVEKYYDKNNNEVSSVDDPNYDHSVTYYYDNAGNSVPEDVVNAAEKIAPTSATYANAYRCDYEFSTGEFESEYFYNRTINYNYAGDPVEYSTWDKGVSLVETNFVPENNKYTIDNIFVEGTDTFMHPNQNGGRNVHITLDMGKVITANTITFLGRTTSAATTAMQGLPKNFSLEISMDGETFTDGGTYLGTAAGAYQSVINLNSDLTFRYVRINVVDTHSNTGRLILSGIKFTYTMRLTGNGNNVIAPDSEKLNYGNGWECVQAQSDFGHVYVGNNGAQMSFTFTGTRLGILSTAAFGDDFEVYIDGVKCDSIEVKVPTSEIYVSYLSDRLSGGTHNVVIKCVGKASIDSVITYDET